MIPKWDESCFGMTQEEFESYPWHNTNVIMHGWTMTGVDTADYWVDLSVKDDKDKLTHTKRVSLNFFSNNIIVKFSPSWDSLLRYTPRGELALAKSEEIRQYIENNDKEYKTYLKLKEKFEK